MKHKSFFVVFLLLCIYIFSTVSNAAVEYVHLSLNYDGKTHQYTEQKVTLKINGKVMSNLTMPPVIFNNLTLVPAREVFEEFGAKVEWNKKTYEVTIKYNDKNVVLKIGDKNAKINGTTSVMSIPAKIINNKTMIPLRFVSTSIGLSVSWDPETRVASVTGKVANNNSSSQNTQTVSYTNITSVTSPSDYNSGNFVINADKAISKMESMFLTQNRLVVDIYDAEIKTSSNKVDVSNFAVAYIRMGQTDNVARVVFDTKGEHKYSVKLSNDKKSINVNFVNDSPVTTTVKETSTETTTSSKNTTTTTTNTTNTTASTAKPVVVGGASYDNYNTELKIKKNGANVNINNATHLDGYNSGIYKITFNGDYTGKIGNATLNINDHNFSTIIVDVTANGTIVTFNEKSILAYNVSEDSENIYISAIKPKNKYKNIVVLDAGHGGHDSGATAQGYYEKNINLDIVNRVLALLEKDDNIKGYATRTTDVYPSFTERNNLGNNLGDMFISVHINSAGSEAANGTEVYYYDAADISLDRGISSSMLAATLQKNLLAKLQSTDRKVKRENFIVLRQSTVPATLCEIGFITNVAEGAKLNSPEYRQLAAEAIYQSIKELFEKYPNR